LLDGKYFTAHDSRIKIPPHGLGILLLVGPSIVWASEFIGSGEVIIATRTGAILGTSVLWAIIIGVFLKFWIGMSGARYTVCTGEGMIDMFARMPGRHHWAVWIVLVAQFIAGTISIASVSTAAGIFLSSLVPINPGLGGWIVTIVAILVAWMGEFKWLKIIMSFLVMLVIIGVFYVCAHVFPDLSTFFKGLVPNKPELPSWVISRGIIDNPWEEILPLLGWSAGGFASQVWYSYWIMGAGFGAAKANQYGSPADTSWLKQLTVPDAQKLKGWCRVVYADSSMAMIIGIAVTGGFLIAGAGVLGPQQIAPDGAQVALQLSGIFSSDWGKLGGILFLVGGTAALISTNIGQLAGWPRLLADAFRICIPAFGKTFRWKTQYRMFLCFFFITNMLIVYSLGYQPVILVKTAAIMEGLLLTPLQAVLIIIGLYHVMPRLYAKEVAGILKPHWIIAFILILATVFFGYFCIYQIPRLL
jgi:Mn2+/Fe2+ NRAMP family transporter